MMKISIITATYNSQKTVRNTIESVLRQTYYDIEYIIVDGASKDNTVSIAKEYEPQFKGRMRIFSEPDKGIYDALNKGISYATGDVIGFIHADDTFASFEILEKVSNAFEQEIYDIVYGDLVYVNSSNSVVRNWQSNTFSKSMVKLGWMPAHPTLYVRKNVYDQFGLFNTSYKISADYDFILRCFFSIDEKKILYLPIIFVNMKIGGASNKNIKNIILKMKEDYKAIKSNHIGHPLIVLFKKNFSKIRQFIK